MKKFECDVCGMNVGNDHEICNLHDCYHIDIGISVIQDVCSECQKEIEDGIAEVNKIFTPIKQSWVRKLIWKIHGRKTGNEMSAL